MTTTAEKIKVMQAFEDGVEIQSRLKRRSPEVPEDDFKDVPKNMTLYWNWENTEYRIKPADPEPLEC